MLYAEIVLPLAQPAYTFSIPQGMELECGDAVLVQFAQRNYYTGIVWSISDKTPEYKRIKSIVRRLYSRPLLAQEQMRFWEWMADYYMCTLGEVMRMALPSMMKPEGRNDEEFEADEFRPRTEAYIALTEEWCDVERLEAECERIARRAPRRSEVLRFLKDFPATRRNTLGEIPRRLVDCDAAMLAALRKAGYIIISERERTIERSCRDDKSPTTQLCRTLHNAVAMQRSV